MPLRILVVDDFDGWRRFVAYALRNMREFEIAGEARDGLEAITKARDLKPDLVILDISLPKLSGWDVARNIRESFPDCKIMFFSVDRSPDTVKNALNSGAQGYVLKINAAVDLTTALKSIAQGNVFVSEGIEGLRS